MTDQRGATYIRQSRILLPETERELFHRRKDGDSGKYGTRQPATELLDKKSRS